MRLIDADLPREQMKKLLDHHLMMGNFSADSAVSDCIEFLDTCPTVDAVPVVRCRDCIHWCEYSGCEELDGKGWCDAAYGETTHALFFCGAGAKMDKNLENGKTI